MEIFVELAWGEAIRRGCPFVGTPHLFLALLQEEPARVSPGARPYSGDLYAVPRALRRLRLDIGWIRAETAKVAALTVDGVPCDPRVKRVFEMLGLDAFFSLDRKSNGGSPGEHPPLSSRARLILEMARGEAARWGHPVVGSEHLLIALLDDEGGVAPKVLAAAGADLAFVRHALRERIGA